MKKMQPMLERTFGFMPDWFVGVTLVCLAVFSALTIHRIVSALLKRAIGPRRSIAVLIFEATSGPTRLAPQSWDLRCEIREKLLAFMRKEMPEALPRQRADISPPFALYENFTEPPAMARAGSEH
jgi:hypothetical protein